MSTVPIEHVTEDHKIQADGYVDLWEVDPISGGTVYFKEDNSVTWQTNHYEGMIIKLSGDSLSSDTKDSRPKLSIGQAAGIFTPFIYKGELDGAVIRRKRVLLAHINSDQNIKVTKTWIIGKVISLIDVAIQLELRAISDGPFYLVPARMFIPPLFPSVSI